MNIATIASMFYSLCRDWEHKVEGQKVAEPRPLSSANEKVHVYATELAKIIKLYNGIPAEDRARVIVPRFILSAIAEVEQAKTTGTFSFGSITTYDFERVVHVKPYYNAMYFQSGRRTPDVAAAHEVFRQTPTHQPVLHDPTPTHGQERSGEPEAMPVDGPVRGNERGLEESCTQCRGRGGGCYDVIGKPGSCYWCARQRKKCSTSHDASKAAAQGAAQGRGRGRRGVNSREPTKGLSDADESDAGQDQMSISDAEVPKEKVGKGKSKSRGKSKGPSKAPDDEDVQDEARPNTRGVRGAAKQKELEDRIQELERHVKQQDQEILSLRGLIQSGAVLADSSEIQQSIKTLFRQVEELRGIHLSHGTAYHHTTTPTTGSSRQVQPVAGPSSYSSWPTSK
ncbi:hypothetical protein BDN72DRAFT_906131 [Pluteus cervinus]|uniref:Uncharacterized protein n=1 Tax=Pluteus cervinus TaxID=181527 RepID=A0ACD2ZZU7_9AGAR|nr:hypothetical protein BDN72DRAFT_906131 [Pluteus cervinus]